jgi:Flp pilus assembly protein TadD
MCARHAPTQRCAASSDTPAPSIRGDFAAAAEHFRTALGRAPGHPQLTASLGLALEESGKLEEAEACFRRALSGLREPPYPLLANLARNLFRQHRYGDALPLFETLATKFGIAEPSLNAAHAVCLAHAGRDDEAESAFRPHRASRAITRRF